MAVEFFLIRCRQLMSSDSEAADRTPPDPVITPCIRNTVEAIIPRIKDFHDILLQPPEVRSNSIC